MSMISIPHIPLSTDVPLRPALTNPSGRATASSTWRRLMTMTTYARKTMLETGAERLLDPAQKELKLPRRKQDR